jgi:TonB family protein
VKKSAFGCLLFFMAAACFGQIQGRLCPKHIETPQYPTVARQTRVTGKITLTVTVDADGIVKNVEAVTDNPVQRAQLLLQSSAVENMQHWTFAKPSSAPYTQVIVYDYEIDPTLRSSGGPSSLPSITKVTIDLPDHVKILINNIIIEPAKQKIHR